METEAGCGSNSCGVGNLLILLPDSGVTSGNYTTVSRIRKNLMENLPLGIADIKQCVVSKFGCKSKFSKYVECNNVTCILALHAAHCSDILQDLKIPYIVIFGGTDINEYAKNAVALNSMKEVVFQACFLVSFGPSMKEKALKLWPRLNANHVQVIPQGVSIKPLPEFNLRFHLKDKYRVTAQNIYLLVASIREVKDPLYVVQTFSNWHSNGHQDSYLIIIGSKGNEDYYKYVENIINQCAGVLLLASMPSSNLQAAIQQSSALVNSSVSEGMASTILEAMYLNTPVVVRNIAGNKDIVRHLHTGLIYESPEECVEMLELLLQEPEVRKKLTGRAKDQVDGHHCCRREANSYKTLIEKIVTSDKSQL